MRRLAAGLIQAYWSTWLGRQSLTALVTLAQYRVFAPRTIRLMKFDLLRLEARSRQLALPRKPNARRLHLGCGGRRVAGWLNVDVAGGDAQVDLAAGRLPWEDACFDAIVAQHVVEHLDLMSELIPLLAECRRVTRPGGEIWLSCPDLERACRSYLEHKGQDLIDDRLTRPHGDLGLDNVPSQQMVNEVFHQGGEHKNLFDLELLTWALGRGGLPGARRTTEREFLQRFPEFPRRNDDYHSIYVLARKEA
jgi:predicted SAM-dependent methyltransferase